MSIELAVAEVLEKVAHFVEATESEKVAAVAAERDRLVTAIQEKVSASTGLDISEDVVDKLSSADPAVLETIEKLAESADSEVLGGPSSRNSANVPLTIDEQVKLAEDNLVNFSVSR